MDSFAMIEQGQIRKSRRWHHFRIRHHAKNQYMADQDNVFAPWTPAFAGTTSANITTILKHVQHASTALTGESVDSLIRKWTQHVQTHNPILLCYGDALLQQL